MTAEWTLLRRKNLNCRPGARFSPRLVLRHRVIALSIPQSNVVYLPHCPHGALTSHLTKALLATNFQIDPMIPLPILIFHSRILPLFETDLRCERNLSDGSRAPKSFPSSGSLLKSPEVSPRSRFHPKRLSLRLQRRKLCHPKRPLRRRMRKPSSLITSRVCERMNVVRSLMPLPQSRL